MFHPAAVRASAVDTPCGAVRATGGRRSWSGLRKIHVSDSADPNHRYAGSVAGESDLRRRCLKIVLQQYLPTADEGDKPWWI
jgi:hypothetical protein